MIKKIKNPWVLIPWIVMIAVLSIAASYATIYKEVGGKRMVIATGGSIDIESGAEIDIESGGSLKIAGTAITASAAEINASDGATEGTVVASKLVRVDSSKDIGDFRNLDATNIDAGVSGTAGTVDVFPGTAAKGKLAITAADNSGDTTTTIVNASQSGARTYTIPDAGASASFLMTAGAQSVSAGQTNSTNGTGVGAVALRFGATITEGLEYVVYEATISPSAVETNTLNTPAGAVLLSVQAQVTSALTGGSTTVTFGLGTTGDPDKYGYPGSDTLAQNAKIDTIPDWAVLGSAEQMVLTGTAAGGTADGDTALTNGSVRIRIVYLQLNSLDDA